ncbi:uncharacterized protein LJ206_016217 [Theristicus caerulescens]
MPVPRAPGPTISDATAAPCSPDSALLLACHLQLHGHCGAGGAFPWLAGEAEVGFGAETSPEQESPEQGRGPCSAHHRFTERAVGEARSRVTRERTKVPGERRQRSHLHTCKVPRAALPLAHGGLPSVPGSAGITPKLLRRSRALVRAQRGFCTFQPSRQQLPFSTQNGKDHREEPALGNGICPLGPTGWHSRLWKPGCSVFPRNPTISPRPSEEEELLDSSSCITPQAATWPKLQLPLLIPCLPHPDPTLQALRSIQTPTQRRPGHLPAKHSFGRKSRKPLALPRAVPDSLPTLADAQLESGGLSPV